MFEEGENSNEYCVNQDLLKLHSILKLLNIVKVKQCHSIQSVSSIIEMRQLYNYTQM